MCISARPYQGDEDYQQMRALLVESYGITRRLHNWDLPRLDGWRFVHHGCSASADSRQWQAEVRLWKTGAGKLVGAVFPEGPGNIQLQIHPDYRGIENEMVAWAEERLAVPTENGCRRVSVPAYDYDTHRQAVLSRRGYQQNRARFDYTRYRSMDAPIPEVAVADGYLVRTLGLDNGDGNWERYCATVNRVFPHAKATVERCRVHRSATYNHDLVVESPDGTVASFCTVWLDDVNRAGIVDPVGTHPNHRQRGLAKVVVCAGLRHLKALGATVVYLGTYDSAHTNRLYESLGFTDVDTLHMWEKVF